MPRWEYMAYELSEAEHLDPRQLEKHLDDDGSTGWELVQMLPARGNRLMLVYKRPVQDAPPADGAAPRGD